MNIRELLGRIEGLKKDLDYTKNLAEKWKPQEERFPIIFEYIMKQMNSFEEIIENSYKLDVEEVAKKLAESGSPAAQVSSEMESEIAEPIESAAPPSADPEEADAPREEPAVELDAEEEPEE